jgi:threonine dehydratase
VAPGSAEVIELRDIEQARARLADAVYRSPCAYSETFSRLTGLRTFFKLENLQMTGSFKERGSLNRILQLTPEERSRGVICASAGNHAQGVAYHATRLGAAATVVMPETTPLIKVVCTREYGGQVVLHGADYDAAHAEARRRAAADGLAFVHAFDDPAVIAGQGTIGLELLDQQPDLDAVIVPIGGGGLAAGVACAVKARRPACRVVGVQAAAIASARDAWRAGAPVELPGATTLADGIAVRRTGDHTLPLLRAFVDEIVTVDEEEIAHAILLLLEREKTVAEGAGAVAVAAAVNRKTSLPAGARTALVVSGGNIDVNILARVIERGQTRDDRLIKLEIKLSDSPGSLHRLMGVFAQRRANVLDIAHSRHFRGAGLGETMVIVTLETRGPDHVDDMLAALAAAGYEHERHR